MKDVFFLVLYATFSPVGIPCEVRYKFACRGKPLVSMAAQTKAGFFLSGQPIEEIWKKEECVTQPTIKQANNKQTNYKQHPSTRRWRSQEKNNKTKTQLVCYLLRGMTPLPQSTQQISILLKLFFFQSPIQPPARTPPVAPSAPQSPWPSHSTSTQQTTR